MPELPEVEIVRRGLCAAMAGQMMKNITVNRRDLRTPIPGNFETILRGRTVVELKRRGKYIIALTERSTGFVLHLGMSGRIRIYGADDLYTPLAHDHVVFRLDGGAQIVFQDPRRFGMLYLTRGRHWAQEKPFQMMGPEPLDDAFFGPVLRKRLAGRKSNIKAALLNQHIIAGVGNIYACEALYKAGISPLRAAHTLTDREADALACSIQDVLRRAVDAGGSTLRDYVHTDGALGYFQYQFAVYDRAGHPCPACTCDAAETGGVHRIVQQGRSTFYCPQTQR